MLRRKPPRVREALFPVGVLISTLAKVLEVPPLAVSRTINQEPKTSWVAGSRTLLTHT